MNRLNVLGGVFAIVAAVLFYGAQPALALGPIVDGWVLTSVGRRGNAIVASRNGFYEVYPGDPLPGVGRVQDIRYQDGRWVVITPKGLIVRK